MIKFSLVLVVAVIFTGCSNLLPTSKTITISRWNNYEDIQKSYNSIINYKTTKKELHNLGFDPFKTSNIKILSHLDILEKFLINSSIKITDLDKGLQECIANERKCMAYETTIEYIQRKRYGSVMLDLFNFKKSTLETGWSFYSLIVINKDTVVYKISNSMPHVNNKELQRNPLGPFQSMEPVLRSAVQ